MNIIRVIKRSKSRNNHDDVGNVKRYFADKYPGRSGLPKSVFRRKEDRRINLAREWFPRDRDISVLDAGCGDGLFLSSIFDGRIRSLRVEDLVADNITNARRILAGRADELQTEVVNSYSVRDNAKYDLVLAIGLFDYYGNWPSLVRPLLDRSKGIMITDFPKSGTLHSVARRFWLGFNQIRLSTINRAGLNEFLASMADKFEVRELDFNWMVKIDKT